MKKTILFYLFIILMAVLIVAGIIQGIKRTPKKDYSDRIQKIERQQVKNNFNQKGLK